MQRPNRVERFWSTDAGAIIALLTAGSFDHDAMPSSVNLVGRRDGTLDLRARHDGLRHLA
jgi:hypothetical protein